VTLKSNNGVLCINRPKVSYLIQWSDFNKNFSSNQIGYVKQGFESSHSGGIRAKNAKTLYSQIGLKATWL
jgi:hypothetical protein